VKIHILDVSIEVSFSFSLSHKHVIYQSVNSLFMCVADGKISQRGSSLNLFTLSHLGSFLMGISSPSSCSLIGEGISLSRLRHGVLILLQRTCSDGNTN